MINIIYYKKMYLKEGLRTTITGGVVILLALFYGSSFFSIQDIIELEKESSFKTVINACCAICVALIVFLLTLLGFSLILYGILDIISFIEKKSLNLCPNKSIQELYNI